MEGDIDSSKIQYIFDKVVWPILNTNQVSPQSSPSVYVLGGQPGAGKSRLIKHVKTDLGENFININGDEFRKLHPQAEKIEKKHGINAAEFTAQFSSKVTKLAIEKAILEQKNVVIEGTFRTTETPIKTLGAFKEKGFQTAVLIATAPKDISWSSTLQRYKEMREDGITPRFTPKESSHDLVISNLPDNVDAVWKSGLADKLKVYNRSEKLHDSEVDKSNPGLTITKEIHRPLTPVEHELVLGNYEGIQYAMAANATEQQLKMVGRYEQEYIERSNKERVLTLLHEKLSNTGLSAAAITSKMKEIEGEISGKNPDLDKDLEL